MIHPLQELAQAVSKGARRGIPSVCSAHPVVIETALHLAARTGTHALIEATCNQVNHQGGYTGLTPAAFRDLVTDLAARAGLPTERLILGGDHLGPNPWRHLPPEAAMAEAETMIAAYAAAGFSKLHLDSSMGCAGEPQALGDGPTAARAARLAKVAERVAPGAAVYVIGTEVPVPGGATHALDHLTPTRPEAALATHAAHRAAFAALGLGAAFERVIALVVQPGVEFGHTDVAAFDPAAAARLSAGLRALPGLIYEAHSTDYQTAEALRGLVTQGFGILKVGPWLTFALREALYGLDAIADVLDGHPPRAGLMAGMERLMQADPGHWRHHTPETGPEAFALRHFSLSDRIRYYWPHPEAQAAVGALMARLGTRPLPAPLVAQYLPGITARTAPEAVAAAVERVLTLYAQAARG